ncbi:MAG: hypothetical protein ACPGJS_10430 [Flammeovirgaceae bacterium]
MSEPLHKTCVLAIILLVTLTISISAYATDDPLGKPNVWQQLQKSPVDSVLWAQYFGKPWICMNSDELSDLKSWREELLTIFELEHKAERDEVKWDDPKEHLDGKLEYVDHQIEAEKQRLDQEMRVYVQELKHYMVEESSTLQRLKKNIAVNFVVIEELYEEEFEKLGVKYVWYEDRYPKGRYNKQSWIHEKEEELKQLKLKEFEKRKSALVKEHY